MYMPRPEPPRVPCFQNFVNTRLRMSGLMPSPSSSTCSSTPAYGASSAIADAVSVTCPSPCRIALSSRLVTTCANLSGSALMLGSSPTTSKAISRPVPARTDATTRSTATRKSTGRRYSESRPVSMRATSSSSAISRVSRSASTLTVSSIIFFWSSLSFSHFESSVATKPFTPVSGERSSWATVATRSERSRSRRSRARAERSETDDPLHRLVRPVAADAGGDEQLGPVGEVPRLLGQRGARGEPGVGLGAGEPAVAGAVLQQHHVGEVLADPVLGAEQPRRRRGSPASRSRTRRRPRRRRPGCRAPVVPAAAWDPPWRPG